MAVEFQVFQTVGRGESTRKVEKRAARYNAARAASSRATRKREKSKVYVYVVELTRGKGRGERKRERERDRIRSTHFLLSSILIKGNRGKNWQFSLPSRRKRCFSILFNSSYIFFSRNRIPRYPRNVLDFDFSLFDKSNEFCEEGG